MLFYKINISFENTSGKHLKENRDDNNAYIFPQRNIFPFSYAECDSDN